MAAGAVCGESVDQYRAEVDRLTQELTEANREKIRAAECGLVVLEENQALKQKYADLETEQEILRKELEQLQEVGGWVAHTHCSQVGISCISSWFPPIMLFIYVCVLCLVSVCHPDQRLRVNQL